MVQIIIELNEEQNKYAEIFAIKNNLRFKRDAIPMLLEIAINSIERPHSCVENEQRYI